MYRMTWVGSIALVTGCAAGTPSVPITTAPLSAAPAAAPAVAPALPGTMGRVRRGQIVQGRMTVRDVTREDTIPHQAWTYASQAGEAITLEVSSPDFFPFCSILDRDGRELGGGSFNMMRDDASGWYISRVPYTLPASGDYRVVASSIRAGLAGRYTLIVR